MNLNHFPPSFPLPFTQLKDIDEQPPPAPYNHENNYYASSSCEINKTVTVRGCPWKDEDDLKNMPKKSRGSNARKEDQKSELSSPFGTDPSSNRVCADCNTTKTPLWRSGPKGPKSLCNACGIRQRKARRAIEAASAAAKGAASHQQKKGNGSNDCSRLKNKAELEDFLISLSKRLAAIHRVFPQDEKDAAILLMALSLGFLHG